MSWLAKLVVAVFFFGGYRGLVCLRDWVHTGDLTEDLTEFLEGELPEWAFDIPVAVVEESEEAFRALRRLALDGE